jgi:hypothetical protein
MLDVSSFLVEIEEGVEFHISYADYITDTTQEYIGT